MTTTVSDAYPKTVRLPNGSEVELRMMAPGDKPAILAFARSLPPEDLMFLRVDLTQEHVVDTWMANAANGTSTTIVAWDSSGLIGYATVHRNAAPWTRRVGEIRVNVAASYRGKGLGRVLTGQIFDLARGLGLHKLMAQMTTDQHGAQAAFRRLGFVPEALLADYVEDRNGTTHDLVLMTYSVDGHNDTVAEPLRV
ncbi:MAG: GNAT family N-acetyltransferase [Pseudomonadales bacterium]|jgi:RimJ/RimL family protein N-acetyltransferase|nr:GNAT family N-acetyltransferase [Pseudomonadales bacterium]